jgi:hypothetical protein
VLKYKKQKSKDFFNFLPFKTLYSWCEPQTFVQTPTKQKNKRGCGFATPTFNKFYNDNFLVFQTN